MSADGDRLIGTKRVGDSWLIFDIGRSSGKLTELYRTPDRSNGLGMLWATVEAAGGKIYLIGAGISVLDLKSGTERLLVEGPPHEFRTKHEWSPSRQTLASAVCDMETCTVHVIDTATDAVQTISGFTLLGLTDDLLFGHAGIEDFRWRAYDLTVGTSRLIASNVIETAYDGYSADDHTLVLTGVDDTGNVTVAKVDSQTGSGEVVLKADPNAILFPVEGFRSADWVVLGDEEMLDGLGDGLTLDLLRVHDGSLAKDAVPIAAAPQ